MGAVVAAVGRWFITPHAVARYIERVDPRASYEVALARLIAESETATRVKEIEPGVALYRGRKPRRLRYRVAETGEGLPQLLTVLSPFDGWRPPPCL